MTYNVQLGRGRIGNHSRNCGATMKFDAARVRDEIERLSMTQGEAAERLGRNADLIANAIGAAGWETVRLPEAIAVRAFRAQSPNLPTRVLVVVPFAQRARLLVRGRHDNVTGLATLAELARTLPRKLYDRAEVQLAYLDVTHRGAWDALVAATGRPLPDPTTLVIELSDPGRGQELILEGNPRALDLACKAAADLWLPHRRSRHWLPSSKDRYGNWVILESPNGSKQIDDAMLVGTSQLVHELALRWSKSVRDA